MKTTRYFRSLDGFTKFRISYDLSDINAVDETDYLRRVLDVKECGFWSYHFDVMFWIREWWIGGGSENGGDDKNEPKERTTDLATWGF